MWTLQKERSVITTGIVLCGAGIFCVVGGIASWRAELRFQAVAVETTATIVPADPPLKGLRFETDQGTVEIHQRMRGFHDVVGSKLTIYYASGNPYDWRRAPRPNPREELILAGVGAGFVVFGAILLVLGWFARRQSGRAYWL